MSEPLPDDALGPPELAGLRERKKRVTRQLISDTASAMFLDRGFDEVRVTEIAAACGVSEKTVYNYFPTKEAMLLDREDETVRRIRQSFASLGPTGNPLDATVGLLARELEELCESWRADPVTGMFEMRRFQAMLEDTTSVRTAWLDLRARMVAIAATALAEQAGVSPDDPEPQIAAISLLGLWQIQMEAVRRYSDGSHTVDELRAGVTTEVRRAARLVNAGLWSFGALAHGNASREQLHEAAQGAEHAGRQVANALRGARAAWRQAQRGQRTGGLGDAGRREGLRRELARREDLRHERLSGAESIRGQRAGGQRAGGQHAAAQPPTHGRGVPDLGASGVPRGSARRDAATRDSTPRRTRPRDTGL